jgi:hypothetical protein
MFLEWSMDDHMKDPKTPPYISFDYSSLEFQLLVTMAQQVIFFWQFFANFDNFFGEILENGLFSAKVWGLCFQILSNKHVLIKRLLPPQNLSMHYLIGVSHNELKHGQIVVSTRQIKIMKMLWMDKILSGYNMWQKYW